MYIDYIRIYQKDGHTNIGCSPKGTMPPPARDVTFTGSCLLTFSPAPQIVQLKTTLTDIWEHTPTQTLPHGKRPGQSSVAHHRFGTHV